MTNGTKTGVEAESAAGSDSAPEPLAGSNDSPGVAPGPGGSTPPAGRNSILMLPGLAAISFYMLVLSGVIVLGVARGGYYPPFFLIFAVGSLAASAGLMRLYRWAWALALAGVFLLTGYNLWIFSSTHGGPALVQGLLNLVFFLYLVRTEVRNSLR
jgi:hypothetical protein